MAGGTAPQGHVPVKYDNDAFERRFEKAKRGLEELDRSLQRLTRVVIGCFVVVSFVLGAVLPAIVIFLWR